MNTRITKKKAWWIIFCFLLIHLFGVISHGQAIDLSSEEREYLRTKGVIVFVSQTRYPPFEFTDHNQQHEGMMLDVVRWMAVEVGFKPVFMDMTFQQAQDAVLSGKADILTSLFYSEKRAAVFSFTEALFEVPASIFVRAERTDIKDLNGLSGKTIAIQRGDHAGDFLESLKFNFIKLDVTDFAEATDRVIAGHADAVIGDEQIVFYHIYSNGLTDHVKKIGEPLYVGRNCMAANRRDALLIGILDKAIHAAGKSGVLDKIGRKWLGKKYGSPKSFLERYRWPLSGAFGGLLLISLWVWAWNIKLRAKDRKKTAVIVSREQALRESEENFRTFFETMDDMIFVGSPDGRIFYTNPAVIKKLGYSRTDLEKMHFLDVHPADKRREAEKIFSAMFSGEMDVCPLPLQKKAGTLIPVETRVWFGKWNGTDCIFGISKDLTKEQEALQKFNRLFNNNPSLMAVSSLADRKFTDINDAFLNMLGFSREEILGKTSAELNLFPEREKQEAVAARLEVHGRITNCELKVRCKDGTLLDGIFSGEIIESHGQSFALTVMMDQTERKHAARELRDSEEKFRSIYDNSLDGILFTAPDGGIFAANPAACKMLGWSEREICKGGRDLVMDLADPRLPLALEERSSKGRFFGELNFRRKEGMKIPMELSSALFTLGNDELRTCIFIRDISDRKRAEAERREANDALRNALGEKEVLLREIHHRVKNNMQVITSLLSLQAERVENEEARQALLKCQQRIHTMSMIHQVLYGSQNLSTIDLSIYLTRLVQYLEMVFKSEADVHIVLEMEKLELGIDQAEPCGLILNELITNAFKHAFRAGMKGTIRIKGYLANNEEVVLEVRDNGVGLPADLENPIASSLGLKLVQGLLRHQLKGRLNVVREGGTAFILRWPLSDGKGDKG